MAFVGAGFSRPLLPSWHELLVALSERTGDHEVKAWLESDRLSHRDYEGVAQALRSQVHDDRHFEALLRQILDPERRPGLPGERLQAYRETFDARLRRLKAIPFHSILTTNFDPLFTGDTPSPETFAKVIGSERRPWWDFRAWSEERREGFDTSWQAPVVKLHGDLDAPPGQRRLAFTTRNYRALVHQQPGYRAFLRTLFATHSVLYMGFSFTDGYINELRSEILAWVGSDRLPDYAIMADVPPLVRRHLRENEGLECLPFEAPRGDFSGFDAWLDAIYRAAAPEATLRDRVSGRRILWFDPNPKNNLFGHAALLDEQGTGGAALVRTPRSVEDALRALHDGAPWDLVISHYGYQGGAPSNFERLMTGMRALEPDRQAPVLVFSRPDSRHQNRPHALKLGAFDYVDSWPELFAAVERVFEPAPGDPSPQAH